MTQKPKNKLSIPMVSIVAVSAVVGSFAANLAIKAIFRTGRSGASVDTVLSRAAEETNRNLPMIVDQFTRLDSTAALPNRRMLYKYTILNGNFFPDDEKLVAQLWLKLVNNYKTSQEMATMREMKATLVYSYSDEAGKEIARFEVGPNDIK